MPDNPTERRDSRAPEGAHCAEHPERSAHFTCVRCGSYACVHCWHPSVERCQQCLKRDPTEAAPPIPWERRSLSVAARYLGTLATAFRPIRSAPAFAHDDTRAALLFMLLSALPFALLSGVIPHTRTLLFAGDFAIRVLGKPLPGAFEIGIDVVRAMGVQLALTAVDLGCLLLPFVSLVRAYAPARRHAALRVLFYRIWLLPASMLVFYVAIWALPSPEGVAGAPGDPPPASFMLLISLRTLVPVLLFLAMGSTARLACGLGPWMSMVVVIVPVALLLTASPIAAVGLERLLPAMEGQPAAGGAGAAPQ